MIQMNDALYACRPVLCQCKTGIEQRLLGSKDFKNRWQKYSAFLTLLGGENHVA